MADTREQVTDTAVDGRQNADTNGVTVHKTLPGRAAHHVKQAVQTDKAFEDVAAVDPQETRAAVPHNENGIGNGPGIQKAEGAVEVLCGPLLNYRRMSGEHTDTPVWHGSVLLVTQPGSRPGELSVRYAGAFHQQDSLTNGASSSHDKSFAPTRLYEDSTKAFFQYAIDVPFLDAETVWEYEVSDLVQKTDGQPVSKPMRFVVASKHASMRIMFHSCNGFSVGTDEEEWSGPALWNDVLRIHERRPIHVMLGGGDQIYNDGVRVKGPLKPWTDIGNPIKRRDFPFNEELRAKCDDYYFDNYVRWYSCKPFSTANGQIPQTQIWDDHE